MRAGAGSDEISLLAKCRISQKNRDISFEVSGQVIVAFLTVVERESIAIYWQRQLFYQKGCVTNFKMKQVAKKIMHNCIIIQYTMRWAISQPTQEFSLETVKNLDKSSSFGPKYNKFRY